MRVLIRRLTTSPAPKRQTPGAAGYDLYAARPARIRPHSFGLVSTGIALQMPKGIEAQVRPRSGLAARHGIGLLNSPGTIDSDYRGEVKVILFNLGEEVFPVRRGDRIAQLVFSRPVPVQLAPSRTISRTRRGAQGFGHTG